MFKNNVVSQIKDVISKNIDEQFVAGANMLVIKDGEEIFYHEDGYADIENKTPINRDSIFRMYSLTKPITATAVMILVERGLIDLFDPVSHFLPGFKDQQVTVNGELKPVNRDVTIKDLLSMTSGLVYGGDDLAGLKTTELLISMEEKMFTDDAITTVDFANRLGKCPLRFQPGSSWEYGLSADVLGAVIEVVSGMSFGEFLKKELFIPLGMKDTDFFVPQEKIHRLVKTYETTNNNELILYTGNNLVINNKMDIKPAFESGGAGLVSTIDDIAKFTKMLRNNGEYNGKQLLKPKTITFLRSASLNENQQVAFNAWHTLSGHTYGNLMRVMTDQSQAGSLGTNGEYGWDGWLGAYFAHSPVDDLIILLMIQKKDAGTTSLTRKLRNIIFSCY